MRKNIKNLKVQKYMGYNIEEGCLKEKDKFFIYRDASFLLQFL